MGLLARLGIQSLERSSTPSNPSAGQRLLYPTGNGWVDQNSGGIARPLITQPGRAATPQASVYKWIYQGTSASGPNSNYAGGTTTLHDTADFVIGSESAKIVTPGSVGVQCGFGIYGGPTLPDMTNADLVLLVKVTGMANAADFKFWLSDSNVMTNAYQWNLSEAGTTFPFLASGQWYRITLPRGATTLNGVAPNNAALNSWQLVVYDNGTPMTVQLGGIGYCKKQKAFPNGAVSIRFDDLLDETLAAADYMAQYGFAATAYAIAETMWNNASYSGYLTTDQARMLERVYNWRIASHAYTVAVHNQTSTQGGSGTAGYTAYTANDQRADMMACRQWLIQQGFTAAQHFAWPQGAWDEASSLVAREVFSSAITLAHAHNETVPVADPNRIRCYAPPNTVTGANLTAEVDKAIAGGEWLIVCFHRIVASVSQAIDVTTAAFQTFVDYLNTTGVSVPRIDEVLAMSSISATPVYETFTYSAAPGNVATGTGKARLYLEGSYQVETVRAAVNTAPTGATLICDVNKNGTTIYTSQGNRPTIAISGFTATGNSPAVKTFAAGDYITVDVDQVGSTITGADLTVTVRLRRLD